VTAAKGLVDTASASSVPSTARPPLPQGASINVHCLPAHDEADQIVGSMIAQVLLRRGFTVTVAYTVSLASELVASIDPLTMDVVVVSALPPKAAIHARYLVKPMISRYVDLKMIVGLWTNTKTSADEFTPATIVTSLDALQDQLDQITPLILMGKTPAPVTAVDESLASAK
jgi:hypothetical protein